MVVIDGHLENSLLLLENKYPLLLSLNSTSQWDFVNSEDIKPQVLGY